MQKSFVNPLSELGTKLIEIGNPTQMIIFVGDLKFPIIDWKNGNKRRLTHERHAQPKSHAQSKKPKKILHRNDAHGNI